MRSTVTVVKPETQERASLVETTYSGDGLAVDRDQGVIKGVKLLGRKSRNDGGREYTDAALNDAARLYEGLKVNVDHPADRNPDSERKIADFFGEIRNVRREPDAVYGDLHYLKKHPLAESVTEAAERFPKQFGMSQTAWGKKTKKGGKWIVESVVDARSVDIVGNPATNSGLFESEEPVSEPPESAETPMPKTVKRRVRDVLYQLPKDTWGRSVLLEQEDIADGTVTMEAPPEEEAAPEPADAIKEAFKAKIIAVFEDDSLDAKETAEKIKTLLMELEKVNANLSDEPAEEAPAEPVAEEPVAEEPVPESLKRELRSIKQRQALMEAENLLLKSGREATKERIAAVAAVAAEHRAKLVESWQPITPTGKRPDRSPPINTKQNVSESYESKWEARAAKARERV